METAQTAVESDAVHERDYLLCIEGERAWRFELPHVLGGEVVIGRGSEVALRLAGEQVSRAHAQLLVVPDGLRLTDLGSRHGTLVNGVAAVAARLVATGDVIAIGGALLVVHQAARPACGRALLDAAGLARRLAEELERSLRHAREVAVIALRGFDRGRAEAVLGGELRVGAAAALLAGDELAVIEPEVDADEAEASARALAAALGGAAIGLAISPRDGCGATGLLAAARAAAAQATRGSVVHADGAVQRIALGEHEVVLADPAMVQIYDLLRRLARSTLPVLIEGETGVGKELAARAVHELSPRAGQVFASINCAAIPEQLAESELFGHERGAFTGAHAVKIGQLEAAAGGTVFLDEIGELSLAVQAKLLRVLDSRELTRVGDVRPRATDIRIVAATNRDLAAEVEAGRFRRDLFFRLGAAQVVVPPLRDRPRDLATLAHRLARAACTRVGRRPLGLSIAAMQAVCAHPWPGNVRELRNALDYAAATAPDAAVALERWHLPTAVTRPAEAIEVAGSELVAATSAQGARAFRPVEDEVRELERQRMIEALTATRGVRNKAAELIEMPLRTFVTKLKRYGITDADWA